MRLDDGHRVINHVTIEINTILSEDLDRIIEKIEEVNSADFKIETTYERYN